MKTRFYLNLLLSLTILSFSCVSKENSLEKYLKTQLNINEEEKFSVIILPFDACNACIHSTLTYISENLELLDINKVIIYNFLSLKSNKIQYGESVFNHKNMIIDDKSKFLDFDFKHNQPMVIHIEKGILIKIENLDSHNFSELLGKIH